MKRILEIKECLDAIGNKAAILTVVDESGESLQGTINIDKLDEIKFIPLETPEKENCKPDNIIDIPKYYVYNPAEQKPKVLYDTYEEAYRNAELVANKYDDCKVFVLEIVAQIERIPIVKTIETNYKTGENAVNTQPRIPF